MRTPTTGFMRKQREAISIKINIWHLIFDSNSTTYIETYVIPTKWLKLAPQHKLHPSLPTVKYLKTNPRTLITFKLLPNTR